MLNFDWLHDANAKLGFAGGVVLSTLPFDWQDLVSTLVLGFFGAVASFLASLFCRYLVERFKAYSKSKDG